MDAPGRSVGVVLLAAGESRRMGQAKQRLPFAGTTLLRHACHVALATPAHPVVVVLGADHDSCAAEIADLPVTQTFHSLWAEGMGGSLRAGLGRLVELAPQTAGALILLADQPLVGPNEVDALLQAWQPPRWPIAAAAYDGILGAPAVFARHLFQEMSGLNVQEGARTIIHRHRAETAAVDTPAASCDIDTPDDYQQILRVRSE